MGGAALPLFLGESRPGRAPQRSDPPRLSLVPDARQREGVTPGPSVLLVEDDPSMRLLCSFNLELAGFTVTTASTGHEGVELGHAERFDLLLLDVMLPDLGGFEVAAQLRADAAARDVPIVFLSARTSSTDLARGRAAGAIDYVTKPFDPVELATRLREDLDELARGDAERVWELRFGAFAEPNS